MGWDAHTTQTGLGGLKRYGREAFPIYIQVGLKQAVHDRPG